MSKEIKLGKYREEELIKMVHCLHEENTKLKSRVNRIDIYAVPIVERLGMFELDSCIKCDLKVLRYHLTKGRGDRCER